MHRLLRRTAQAAVTAPLLSRRVYSTPGKVKVFVTQRDGTPCEFESPVGISLMQALRDVAGLDVAGSCDGEMLCCTCHVYLSARDYKKVGEPEEEEMDMLDKAMSVQETSRLACQVDVTAELDGLQVQLPPHATSTSE